VFDYAALNFGFYQLFNAEFPPVGNAILAQVTAAWMKELLGMAILPSRQFALTILW
jgi:hypothetical protein